MPQMAPLSWLNLFILFSISYLIMNSLNYFAFSYQASTTEKKMKKKNISWKW